MRIHPAYALALAAALGLTSSTFGAGKDAKDDGKMLLAEGRFEMTVPENWQRKQPRVNIIDYEFEVPASDGDANPGRMTVMGAGGTVEDNLNRWYGQFRQTDDSATSKAAKVEQKEVASQKVTVVDVAGTYLDKPGGPFAGGPTIERADYRMLAAVVETTKKGKKTGNYFIKLIGPKQTIADSQEAFAKMIESLKEK
jgi:hypothetical protein